MSLKDQLQDDMKAAMRSGDKLRLGAIRMAIAAIKKQEIEVRGELADDAIISLLGKLIKQGRDAESQFRSGSRDELADKEAAEVAVFEQYMPKPLSDDELEALIGRAIESTGAAGAADMGRVMGVIKAEAAGRADLGAVSKRVREILARG